MQLVKQETNSIPNTQQVWGFFFSLLCFSRPRVQEARVEELKKWQVQKRDLTVRKVESAQLSLEGP